MKKSIIVLSAIAAFMCGCQSSTPQASEEVKQQVLGRKPTNEELQQAMSKAADRQKGPPTK